MSSLTAFLAGCGDLLNLCPQAPAGIRTRSMLSAAEALRHDQQALRADADRALGKLNHERPEVRAALRDHSGSRTD